MIRLLAIFAIVIPAALCFSGGAPSGACGDGVTIINYSKFYEIY